MGASLRPQRRTGIISPQYACQVGGEERKRGAGVGSFEGWIGLGANTDTGPQLGEHDAGLRAGE